MVIVLLEGGKYFQYIITVTDFSIFYLHIDIKKRCIRKPSLINTRKIIKNIILSVKK